MGGTTYPAAVARALHALAESRPTPERYARERARILQKVRRFTSPSPGPRRTAADNMRLTLALLLALILVGCPPAVDPPPPEPPDDGITHAVDGAWEGTVQSDLEFTFPLALELRAAAGVVAGVARLPAEPVETTGQVTGTTGDTVTLRVVIAADGDRLAFTLEGETDGSVFAGVVRDLLNAGGSFRMERP